MPQRGKKMANEKEPPACKIRPRRAEAAVGLLLAAAFCFVRLAGIPFGVAALDGAVSHNLTDDREHRGRDDQDEPQF